MRKVEGAEEKEGAIPTVERGDPPPAASLHVIGMPPGP
jgi:hypothetical protein